MAIEDTLGDLGCTIVGPVSTVARALALIEREALDFAILDVTLGRERSTAVAEALRANGIPFALATGYKAEQLSEEALRNAPLLGKPVDVRLLERALADLRRGQPPGADGFG